MQREDVKGEGAMFLIARSIRSPNKLLVAYMAIPDIEPQGKIVINLYAYPGKWQSQVQVSFNHTSYR